MDGKEWLRQMEEQAYERAFKQSVKTGHLNSLSRVYAIRIGRPLTEAESNAIRWMFDRVGPDRMEEVVLSFSAEAVAAWLSDR